MGRIGTTEILLIALVILVLFGGPRIPNLMRGLGQGIREFRKELRGDDSREERTKETK